MENLILLTAYILFLFVQAIFINGIRISAVGETEILPDGSKRHGEMIFYPLYRFMTQKTYKKVFYSGEEYSLLLTKILDFSKDSFNDKESLIKSLKFIDSEIKLESFDDMQFYKEIEFYKFSKYIRKPIIQCIICMASFWGIFTYWPLIAYLYGINIFTLILWVINTICLSYVNYLVYKKH